MERLAPAGPVYQAGTLAGNPVAVAAGLAALRLIEEEDPYPPLIERAGALAEGVSGALADAGVAHTVNRAEPLFSVFFGEGSVTDYETARTADHRAYARFFHGMLERACTCHRPATRPGFRRRPRRHRDRANGGCGAEGGH